MPEAQARDNTDDLLVATGWVLDDISCLNLGTGVGVVVLDFPIKSGVAD